MVFRPPTLNTFDVIKGARRAIALMAYLGLILKQSTNCFAQIYNWRLSSPSPSPFGFALGRDAVSLNG
jgi:hypothetical protein